jgi:hypothetical protein
LGRHSAAGAKLAKPAAGISSSQCVLDLACCHILLSEIAPEVVDNPQRPLAVNAAAQSEYAWLAGMSQAALTATVEPYLPIVRVLVLLGGRCLSYGSG